MSPAALLILALLAADPAPPPPAKLEFPLAGYRINAIDPATKEFYFDMFLPPSSNSYLSKVNIVILPQKEGSPSLQNQVKDLTSYFTQSGNKILLERAPSPTEWLGEFTTNGRDQAGPKEHIYERLLVAHGRTYFITAIALDAQWPALGPKFKASVDSFELSPDPTPGKVSFPQQGFRFSVLDGAAPGDAKQTLLMQSSASGRTAVTIEPYTKTLKDYQAERKPPIMLDSRHKFKILEEKASAENALVTEYAEEFPPDKSDSPDFHLLTYEKVFIAHGQLYRVSTDLMNEPDPQSVAQIKAWVDSLEPMPTPTSAPAPAK